MTDLVHDLQAATDKGALSDLKKKLEERSIACITETPQQNAIIFQSAYPPDSKWRYLSNMARREFDVDLPCLNIKNKLPSVEALYQGLKLNLTHELAIGGALEGAV
jgi:hypothetical protein